MTVEAVSGHVYVAPTTSNINTTYNWSGTFTPTSGNCLVAFMQSAASSSPFLNPTGWTRVATSSGLAALAAAIWIKPNCSSSDTSGQFSSDNQHGTFIVREFSGGSLDLAELYDAAGLGTYNGSTASTTPRTGTTGTLTQANGRALAFIAIDSGSQMGSSAWDSGWAPLNTSNDWFGGVGTLATKAVTTTDPIGPVYFGPLNLSYQYFGAVVVLYEASSGTTTVSNDAADSYLVRAIVSGDFGDSYNLRSSTNSDFADNYVLRSSINSDVTDSYVLRGDITGDLADSYLVRTFIDVDSTDSYLVRTSISNDITDSYLLRNNIDSDIVDNYIIRSSISGDLADSYSIENAGNVSNDVVDSYVIRNFVSSEVADNYSVRSAVTVDIGDTYNLRIQVSNDTIDTYLLRSSVNNDIADSYDLRNFIYNEYADTYSAAGVIYSDFADTYNLLAASLLTPEDITAIVNAVLLALNATAIPVNVMKVNSIDVDGTGTELDPWGPV